MKRSQLTDTACYIHHLTTLLSMNSTENLVAVNVSSSSHLPPNCSVPLNDDQVLALQYYGATELRLTSSQIASIRPHEEISRREEIGPGISIREMATTDLMELNKIIREELTRRLRECNELYESASVCEAV